MSSVRESVMHAHYECIEGANEFMELVYESCSTCSCAFDNETEKWCVSVKYGDRILTSSQPDLHQVTTELERRITEIFNQHRELQAPLF